VKGVSTKATRDLLRLAATVCCFYSFVNEYRGFTGARVDVIAEASGYNESIGCSYRGH
jgi:hypothetical protein